ncbi:cytochrome c biogenesis protein CcdA [Candidatus Woesearchaeota archaeon]|nr:cytochrome c biogenesis protein CcdA [Candidatus Woesearchaeota archaeon]
MRLLLFVFAFLLLLSAVQAASLQDFARIEAITKLRDVSFAIAFLGGVLSIFSPCTVAVLPAFLSYTFKERREVLKMTSFFFLGFSVAFVILGIVIAYLGKVTYVYFQNESGAFIQAIGFLLLLFGIMTILGRGFTFLSLGMKPRHDVPGVMLFGGLFAVGWSACTGPIIAGILSIAAVLNNFAYAALLLFFYSLGIAVPLFVMAYFYDRHNLAEHPIIRGREFSFSLFGQDFSVHTTKALAGLMLVTLGLVFIFFRGTTVLTQADLLARMALMLVLLAFAWLLYRQLVCRLIKLQNIRHLSLVLLVALSVVAYLYVNSRVHLTTVGLTEDLDRVLLQHSGLFSLLGIVLLAILAALGWVLLRKRG